MVAGIEGSRSWRAAWPGWVDGCRPPARESGSALLSAAHPLALAPVRATLRLLGCAEVQALGFKYRPTDVLGMVPDPHYTPPPALPRPMGSWDRPGARPPSRATAAAAAPAAAGAGGRGGWRQRLGKRWLPYAQSGALLAVLVGGLLCWRPRRGGGSPRRVLELHVSPRHPSPKLVRAGSKPLD